MTTKWRILLLDTKKENPNHYIALAIYNALVVNPDVELAVKADYGNAINRAREKKCNLFFAFDGEEMEAALCKRLGLICGRSIAWYVEDPYELPVNKRNTPLFDLVFTNDRSSVHEYGAKGRHLPLAACAEMHLHKVKESGHRYDLFFAGTAWPNRIELIKSIEKDVAGIKLKLALPTNEHLPVIDLKHPASSYCWRTPNTEFARFSNHSALVLLLHRQFTASGGRAESATPGPRLFEVAMAGGFQLVDREIPGVSDYLREGNDFAAFSSPEECVEKIKYYLVNSNERIKMARSAQERILREHTYGHRVSYILEQLEKLPSNNDSRKVVTKKDKPCILVVCHNLIGHMPYGGVEIYLELIRTDLAKEYKLLYYLPDRRAEDGRRYLLLDRELKKIKIIEFPEGFPVIGEHMLSCVQREKAFAGILYNYGVDLVHFQHLIGHIPSLPYIAKSMGVPSIYSMHDYYSISHRFNLIDHTGRYRKTTFSSERNTDICLAEAENIMPGSQAKRLAFWGRMLSKIDLIHANSATTKHALLERYPHLDDLKILQEGIPLDETQYTEAISGDPFKKGPLEVLVLGNFTREKGAETLLRVFDETRGMGIRFHVHGRIDKEYLQLIGQLQCSHVHYHDVYDNKKLAFILKGKHVSLHLSIWPETYCITLSECWRGGLIPVVSDIGALGERVKHGLNGFKTVVEDVGAVVDILQRLSIDRELIKRIRGNISSELHISTKQHVRWLSQRYKDLIGRYPVPSDSKHLENIALDLRYCGVRLNTNYWAEIRNHPTIVMSYQTGSRVRIPRHPYYLLRFMVQQIRTRGIRVTAAKVIKSLKSRI